MLLTHPHYYGLILNVLLMYTKPGILVIPKLKWRQYKDYFT
jgi:hypothetical protein